MPKWSDFGNVLTTIRELDVSSIRNEADLPVTIVCVGHEAAVEQVGRLLYQGPQRYPLSGASPLLSIPIAQAAAQTQAIARANLMILAIDARRSLSAAEADGFGRLDTLAIPYLLVVVYGAEFPGAALLAPATAARTVAIVDPDAADAPDQLATALLDRLPSELHVAAARRLPGLRQVCAHELIASTSFSNAAYSLASGLPEQIPLLNVPFAAADILILTKNQALLVYRLALAHGAPPDFQARIHELVPVLGGAFLWRQAARGLVGLIPIWGLLPKVAVAYAGTYTTGMAAWRWYASGEVVSREQLARITREALALGRERAEELVAKARFAGDRMSEHARAIGDEAGVRARGIGAFVDRARARLPFVGRTPRSR